MVYSFEIYRIEDVKRKLMQGDEQGYVLCRLRDQKHCMIWPCIEVWQSFSSQQTECIVIPGVARSTHFKKGKLTSISRKWGQLVRVNVLSCE
jgi:hypothetical protein